MIEIAPCSRSLFPLGEERVCTFVDGSHRRAVGGDSRQHPRAGAAGDDGARWATVERSAGRAQRDPLGLADGSAVGGPSAALPTAADVPRSLPEVGARGCARPSACRAGRGSSTARQGGLDRSLHRRHPRRRKKGGLAVGVTRRGKATKIMAVADRHGLPVAVGIASGERHETKLVLETLDARFLKELPEKLIGDRAYDSDGLDEQLAARGVQMISPHRPNRKNKTQDGRPLRRYRRRWHVERLFAWMLRFRRLVTRYECHARNFYAFTKLACIVILVRQPAFRGTSPLGDSFPFNRLSDAF